MADLLKAPSLNLPTPNFSFGLPSTISQLKGFPTGLSGSLNKVQGLGNNLNAMAKAGQEITSMFSQKNKTDNTPANVAKASDASTQEQPKTAEETTKDGKGGSALTNALGGAIVGGLLGGTGGAIAGALAGGTGALGKVTGAISGANGKTSALGNVLNTVAQTAVTATVAKTVLGGAGGNIMAKATIAMGAVSVVNSVANACKKKKSYKPTFY